MRRLFMQHKPHSFLSPSTKPTGNKRFAIDLLSGRNAALHWSGDAEPRTLPDLKCAGRLDADSTGLMLWSPDSALVERVIGSQSSVEKECTLLCTRCLERAPTPALLRARSNAHAATLALRLPMPALPRPLARPKQPS